MPSTRVDEATPVWRGPRRALASGPRSTSGCPTYSLRRPSPPKNICSNGKYHRQSVYRRGEPACPTRPPGPELRRNVVQDLRAGPMRRLGHPEVEAGIVDQDDEVIAPHFEIIPESPQQPIVGPDLGDHFDQPKRGEPLHPITQRGAGLIHLRARRGPRW